MSRIPHVIHHTGLLDSAAFPRNSLEAVRASLEAGARQVEIDIVALASDDYLLVHDPVLDTETTGTGRVSSTTPDQIRPLFIRGASGSTPYHVPLLSEIVALFLRHDGDARLQLDFKNTIPFADPEPLDRLLRLIESLGQRVIVSSGADWQLRALRRRAAWLQLGFDPHIYLESRGPGTEFGAVLFPRAQGAFGYWDDHPTAAEKHVSTAAYLAGRCDDFITLASGARVFYVNFELLLRSLDDGFNWAKHLHRHDIALAAWTIDAPRPAVASIVRRLAEAGVDFFTTNTPLALQKIIADALTALED